MLALPRLVSNRAVAQVLAGAPATTGTVTSLAWHSAKLEKLSHEQTATAGFTAVHRTKTTHKIS